MKITPTTAADRKTRGAAVDFIVQLDHMGGQGQAEAGQGATYYMSRELLQELGRAIGEALLPGVRGKLLDRYWAELDDIMERLQAGAEAEDDVGKARNAAYFIAILKNAVQPDMEAVREEAYDRWAAAHPDEAAEQSN